MAWTTPRTWTPGELVTALKMNQHVRDNLNFLRGAYQTQVHRGLVLGTHPDQDSYANKVKLWRADEIVMSDGERVSDWSNLVADISTSGAGGLDTGVEEAFENYEIYAIRKSTDGTKNLILHKAKKFTPAATYAYSNKDVGVGLRNAASNSAVGQGFKAVAGTYGFIDYANVYVTKVGAPTGRIWLEIRADDGAGKPSATVLATSDKLDVSVFPATEVQTRFVFRQPYEVTDTTQYHLVVQCDATVSGSNYVTLAADQTAPSYADGAAETYNGATWTALGADLIFTIYVRINDAAVQLPAGYDQYAFLGFVNNGSADFTQFYQLGKHVTFRARDVFFTITSSVPTLSGTALWPPAPIRAKWGIGGNTATAYMLASSLMNGPVTSMAAGGDLRNIPINSAAPQIEMNDMLVEFQSCYLLCSSGTGYAFIRGYELL